MACGITGYCIDQMLISDEKRSKRDFQLVSPVLLPENDLDEPEARRDQEEVKGGTQGG